MIDMLKRHEIQVSASSADHTWSEIAALSEVDRIATLPERSMSGTVARLRASRQGFPPSRSPVRGHTIDDPG